MNLHSIPPELLRNIIEAAVPHSYHSTTYPERQQTLCNLCLVARRFRQIAQPLLFEIVKIETDNGFEKLHRSLSARDRTDANIKTLICISRDGPQKWLNTSALDKLSVVCPAVSALAIIHFGASDLSLATMSSFRHLSNLHLYGLSFRPSTSFLSLQSLSLVGSWATRSVCCDSDSGPLSFPSLRYLALSDVDEVFRDNPLSNERTLARLLPQLEAWSIDFDGLEDAQVFGGYSTLRPFLSRALVDCYIWSEEPHPPRSKVFNDVHHLRLLHDFRDDELERFLSLITSIVETWPRSNAPRSIHLTRSPQGYPDDCCSHVHSHREVEKVCKEKGIEIVVKQRPCIIVIDPVVSQEFWRRMKLQRYRP